ncbi:MAG: hypothetical protein IPM39_28955 [Chloroflexi bacterium]|nr:hypothetical protein [Chloroflexota bacterium]
MTITRDVILDLLPLYLANEASADTRALVEEFLNGDPQLTKLIEQSKVTQFDFEVPTPLTKEHEMKTFEKTRFLLFQQKLFLALAVATTLFLVAFRFDETGVTWLWAATPGMGWAMLGVASLFWIAFLNANWMMNREG